MPAAGIAGGGNELMLSLKHFGTRFCSAKPGALVGGESGSAGLWAVPGKCVGQMAIQVGLIEHVYFCGFSKAS